MSTHDRRFTRISDIRRGDTWAPTPDVSGSWGVVISARHTARHKRTDRPVRGAGAGIRKATSVIVVQRNDGRTDTIRRDGNDATFIVPAVRS